MSKKKLGVFPDNGHDLKIGIGRFGPYVQCQTEYRSVPKTDDIFTVSFERAVELMRQPKRGRGSATVLKELGKHPKTGGDIVVMSGRYGPYIKYGKVNRTLTGDEKEKPTNVDLKKALEILADTEYVAETPVKKKTSAPPKTGVKAKKKQVASDSKKKEAKGVGDKVGDKSVAKDKMSKAEASRPVPQKTKKSSAKNKKAAKAPKTKSRAS